MQGISGTGAGFDAPSAGRLGGGAWRPSGSSTGSGRPALGSGANGGSEAGVSFNPSASKLREAMVRVSICIQVFIACCIVHAASNMLM